MLVDPIKKPAQAWRKPLVLSVGIFKPPLNDMAYVILKKMGWISFKVVFIEILANLGCVLGERLIKVSCLMYHHYHMRQTSSYSNGLAIISVSSP